GHYVIVSHHFKAYFNYPHHNAPNIYVRDTATMLWMPALRTERACKYEPVPDGAAGAAHRRTPGSERTPWPALMPETEAHSYLFPRLCAFSEVVWTPREKKDWGRFSIRLEKHLKKLDALGVRYYTGPQADDTWKQIYPPDDKRSGMGA